MKRLNKEELINIKGGLSFKVALCLGAAFVFIVGVFDGYIRPLRCNK